MRRIKRRSDRPLLQDRRSGRDAAARCSPSAIRSMPTPTSPCSRATCRTRSHRRRDRSTALAAHLGRAGRAASRLTKVVRHDRCRFAPAPITVSTSRSATRSYDIVIGRGLIASLGAPHRRAAAAAPRSAIVTDETVARSIISPPRGGARPRRHRRRAASSCPPGEGSKSFRGVRAGLRGADRRPHRARRSRDRARRRRGRRSRRLRRRRSCAAASTTCRCRRRCWRRSIPRSAARPRSIPPTARTWSARSISRSWWSPTPRCSTRLPPREFRAGYAEVVKYGLLGDAAVLRLAGSQLARAVRRRSAAREHAIATSCRAKAAIVARDERETGDRALLNLGHTFGHALEAAPASPTGCCTARRSRSAWRWPSSSRPGAGSCRSRKPSARSRHLAGGRPADAADRRPRRLARRRRADGSDRAGQEGEARQADIHPGARHRRCLRRATTSMPREVRAFLAEKLAER